MTRYFVSRDGGPAIEVDRAAYVRAERDAGFRPKAGMNPDAPATASFSHHGPRGRLSGWIDDPASRPPSSA